MDYAAQIAYLIVFGIGFGLAATVPPGPMNTQIARRTLKFGFLPGLAFGAGSIFIENALAIAAGMGYGESIGDHPSVLNVTLFVGFIVLMIVGTFALVSGYRAWQDPEAFRQKFDDKMNRRPVGDVPTNAIPDDQPLPPPVRTTTTKIVSMPRAFFAGIGMAIVSPYTILFWIVGLPSVAHDHLRSIKTAIPLLIGVFAGTSAWIVGYTAMIAWLKRYRSTGMWADLIGGTMLLIFAAMAFFELVGRLHGPSPSVPTINGGHFP